LVVLAFYLTSFFPGLNKKGKRSVFDFPFLFSLVLTGQLGDPLSKVRLSTIYIVFLRQKLAWLSILEYAYKFVENLTIFKAVSRLNYL